MPYGNNPYRRGGYRRSYVTAGRVAKPNRRPGACRACSEPVPAFGGQLWREDDGAWSVVHAEQSQSGWLMNPQPVTGGCPTSTDRRNAELHAAGFFGKDAPAPTSERDRIASAASLAASLAERDTTPRRTYAYTSAGARMSSRRGRCEDAPCCGCCD